jgi:ABC-2 type transport system ATP-binding protein
MSEPVIEARGLKKDYGPVHALRGVDLRVERGEIFGFLGPNGAGKSTTIRVLLGLLNPTAGSAAVLGHPVPIDEETRARIGYLPGELSLEANRSAGETLRYLARLRGGRGADRIAPLAERFGLDLDRRFSALSKGNKQKVGLVQAFMHQPELLILDEPSSGLDPLLQQEFLDLVAETREEGATVFMSSHVLSEVDAIAGRVAIIREGVIVDVEEVGTLRSRAGQHVELRFSDPVTPREFAAVPELTEVTVTESTLVGILRGEPDRLLKAAAAHHVVGWSAHDRGLDELFLELYRDEATAGEKAASTEKENVDVR